MQQTLYTDIYFAYDEGNYFLEVVFVNSAGGDALVFTGRDFEYRPAFLLPAHFSLLRHPLLPAQHAFGIEKIAEPAMGMYLIKLDNGAMLQLFFLADDASRPQVLMVHAKDGSPIVPGGKTLYESFQQQLNDSEDYPVTDVR